ncbi:hypothetical protein [Porticoccus sp.]
MLSTLLKVLIPQFIAGALDIVRNKSALKDNMRRTSTKLASLPAAIAVGSASVEGPLPSDNLEALLVQLAMSIVALVLFFLRPAER